MVRFIYSFVIGMLFLNLQAYGMVDDMDGANPRSHAAAQDRDALDREIAVIQKVDRWEHFGQDFGEMLDRNATYFLEGLELDVAVWHTFTRLYSSYQLSKKEISHFREIQWTMNEARERDLYSYFVEKVPEIMQACKSFVMNKKKYETQKRERLLARQERERLAEQEKEQEKERLAAKLRADNSSISSFLDFFTLSLPDSSELTDWRR